VKANYPVISYSELSKTYLNNLTQALADSNFEVASRLSTELVLSLGFNSIFNFKAVQTQICLTINRTKGFEKDPSTITTVTPPTMTTISADQLTAILTQVNNSLGTALAGVTVNATVIPTPPGPKETNIVKVEFFSGKTDEDPTEWIEKFERAKDANNWQDARLRFIAGGLMSGEAADWYQTDKANIIQWAGDVANSFKERFIARFSTVERMHKWQTELMDLK
jgi:hypothetical protein